MRIGIFDSGIGGVNVLSCLKDKYPNNEYIYFGDTKNIPYGDKTREELLILACNAIDFLLTKNVDIIIIACGTISSTCYKKLKSMYNIPIYDIISPTINYLKKSKYNNIGVIGTRRTIESGIFDIKGKNILMKKTPSFVPIIENNQVEEKKNTIIDELKYFKNCDVLVLGCTHYPILENIIHSNLGIKTINMGKCLSDSICLSNDNNKEITLYFSLINDNLLINIKNILHDEYKIIKK